MKTISNKRKVELLHNVLEFLAGEASLLSRWSFFFAADRRAIRRDYEAVQAILQDYGVADVPSFAEAVGQQQGAGQETLSVHHLKTANDE